MRTFKVDLYDYYKIERKYNTSGYLTTYIYDNCEKIGKDRLSPAMLVIPGGGYGFCSQREGEPVALRYLSYGFKTFVLDYSVAPVRYPYPLIEAIMAINYIRENADAYNIEKNKVSAIGFSAGGHLCSMLGSIFDSVDIYKIFKPTENVRPDALILGYPVITSGEGAHIGSFNNLCGEENIELQNKLDITNLVNKNSSPAFIFSTSDDETVPVINSLLISTSYAKHNVPFSLHIFGTGKHGCSLNDITVYNKDDEKLNNNTKSLSSWVSLSIEWLKERDLYF